MRIKETKTLALTLIFFTLTMALLIGCEKPPPIGPGGPTGPGGNNSLRPPVANAGPDQTVDLLYNNYFITLDGRKSYDSSGGSMDFRWRQLSGPAVQITLETTAQPSVLLGPNSAVYSFELRVTNIKGSSADTVQIIAQVPNYCQTVRNEIPVTLTYITDVPDAYLEMLTSGNKLIFPDFTNNFQGVPGNKIYIYDRQTGNWNTITASLPRHSVSTVVANNKIFVAGGIQQNGQPTRVVDIYDLSTNTWSVTQLSEARAAMSKEVLGNKVFFAGGFDNTTALSKKIDIYDLQTNTWSTHELPTGRVNITTVATPDKVLFSGGYTQYDVFSGFQNPTRMINIYHAASGSWSVDSLSVNKVDFAGVAINEKAFFAGGFLNENPTYHVESLDMSSLQRSSSCLREPIASWNKNSAIVKNDRVIFYPFDPFTQQVRSKFDIYNWQTNNWSVGVIPANLVQGSDHAALAILGQDIYILIGHKLYRINNI